MTSEHDVHPLAAAVDEEMLWERAKKLDIPVNSVKLFDAIEYEIGQLKFEVLELQKQIENSNFQKEQDDLKLVSSVAAISNDMLKTIMFAFAILAAMIGYLIWKVA